MTSRQLKNKLDAAIGIIELCERVFTEPDKAARRDWDLDAKYAIADFMEAHREEQSEGGHP
jgi:hypothetical protein